MENIVNTSSLPFYLLKSEMWAWINAMNLLHDTVWDEAGRAE